MTVGALFHEGIYNIGANVIDLDGHTFKAVLSNTAPNLATATQLSDITEIANGNGYTTGGVTLTGVSWTETGSGTGVYKWLTADFEWQAVGGSMAPFQYVIIVDDTASGDPVLYTVDYGAPLTITAGNKFIVDIGSDGIFHLGAGVIS